MDKKINKEEFEDIEKLRKVVANEALFNFMHGNKEKGIKPGEIKDFMAAAELSSNKELKKVAEVIIAEDSKKQTVL